jgi:hypothetical protein
MGRNLIRLYQALGRIQNNQETIKLLFDSKSIEESMPKLSGRAISILKYQDVKPLVFLRTEYSAKNALLEKIPEIHVLQQENGHKYVETPNKGKYGLRRYADQDAQWLGKEILNTETLTKKELEIIELVFIEDAFNRFEDSSLLVTENNVLLGHRRGFQRKFPSTPLNIMSMEEAAEYVDLVFKFNSQFLISPHMTTSKNGWYWYSFTLKIPHYHVDFTPKTNPTLAEMLKNSMMDGFSQRVSFLLMSIDEMGFQHFSGANNDTEDGMLYHFNYFILLMTGIFDSLALQTRDKYKLTFDGSNNPSRISLNPSTGKEFLKALKAENLPLRQHIQNNCDLIKAPYLLREAIAHREGLHATLFDDNGCQANLITVPTEFIECLRRLGDTNRTYVQMTDFGICSGSFLDPFQFSKKIASLLFVFCDKYLELMGYTQFADQQPTDNSSGSFSNTLAKFMEDNLGF